jgi:hypothetical protein
MFGEDPQPDLTLSDSVPMRTCSERAALGRVLNIFVLVYHMTHNLLVPLVTWILQKRLSPLHLEWSWTYHGILTFLLLRSCWNDKILQFWLAAGGAQILYRLYSTQMTKSWHSFSIGLTVVSTLAVLIYMAVLLRDCPADASCDCHADS